jgi:hypothetical protein
VSSREGQVQGQIYTTSETVVKTGLRYLRPGEIYVSEGGALKKRLPLSGAALDMIWDNNFLLVRR